MAPSLSASAGDRIALVGRNGSGKSTLLKIAAGLIEPQDGEVFRQPSATVRYLPQMPDMDGFATVRAYVEAGLGPADDPLPRHLSDGASRPDRRGRARTISPAARRGAPRWPASWRRSPTSCCSTSRPTISTCRPSNGWKRSSIRTSSALIVISHDRRFLERVSRATVWLDRGQTRRLDKGFGAFRGMARHGPGRGRARAAQARPPDRARGALAALRRDRAAQAQHAPARRIADHAPALSRPSRRRRHGDHGGQRRRRIRQAGDRGEGHREELWRSHRGQGLLDPHPARRPRRPRRPERRRQDDAAEDADRRADAGRRHGAARHQSGDRHARPEARGRRSRRRRWRII